MSAPIAPHSAAPEAPPEPATAAPLLPLPAEPGRPCPCGSGRSLGACCLPAIEGATPAATAEALMRSRYTAYTLRRLEYLEATLAPEARGDYDRASAEKWARDSEWTGLHVRATEAGGPDDDYGTVEFVAAYRMEGMEFRHHERSRFVRRDGRWLYLDGRMGPSPRSVEKVGRNDPCPCGSGRKYKKCHGA